MSTTLIVAFLVLCAVILVLWRFAANAAAILAVAGVVALAAWVTVVQVNRYHTQKAIDAQNAAAQATDLTTSATPPLPPAVAAPPMMNGLTGGAAPAVAQAPRARS